MDDKLFLIAGYITENGLTICDGIPDNDTEEDIAGDNNMEINKDTIVIGTCNIMFVDDNGKTNKKGKQNIENQKEHIEEIFKEHANPYAHFISTYISPSKIYTNAAFGGIVINNKTDI